MIPSIYAVPGFLGLPSDWDFLKSLHVVGVNSDAFPWDNLPDWGTKFNQWVSRQEKGPSFLIGYSLGGRLVLHALLNNPDQWKGAVIVSAHLGLSDPNEKRKRLEQDRQWAERFKTEKWRSLMHSWNQQDVFSDALPPFERKEQDYQREQLIQTLLYGSLSSQEDLRQQVSHLEMPILWITGGKDHRFSSLAQTISFKHSKSQWIKVEGAGHRVPWDQPETFIALLQNFLDCVI